MLGIMGRCWRERRSVVALTFSPKHSEKASERKMAGSREGIEPASITTNTSLLIPCFSESSNSNKAVTQLNAMTERRSLLPFPMMPSITVTTL